MMGHYATVKANINPELKAEATAVLDAIGLSMSSAIEITLRQIVAQRGMPFDVKIPQEIPNATTIRAMKDAEEGRVFEVKRLRDLLDD